MHADRILDDLRGDARVSIHVAPGPRVDPYRAHGLAEGLAVDPLEGVGDGVRKLGHDLPEHVLHVPEDVLDLAGDGGAARAYLAGLPEDPDLLADRRQAARRLQRRHAAAVALLELLGDAVDLLEDRPPGGLGGVGGEGEDHAQRAQRFAHPLGAHPRLARLVENGLDRTRLRRRIGVLGMRPGAPDPVVLLRQVDELEIGGEGAGDDLGVVECERADDGSEAVLDRLALGLRPAAPRDGELADLLLEIEEPLALVRHQNLAQDLPEKADVLPQGTIHLPLARHGL